MALLLCLFFFHCFYILVAFCCFLDCFSLVPSPMLFFFLLFYIYDVLCLLVYSSS
ncbi:hypothetical protein DFJ77DRAFT_479315 [Powellomyces hirtus]|nr:hypothetical protein DFJ77DRAFT_479315 [Powellomyces hirtus]